MARSQKTFANELDLLSDSRMECTRKNTWVAVVDATDLAVVVEQQVVGESCWDLQAAVLDAARDTAPVPVVDLDGMVEDVEGKKGLDSAVETWREVVWWKAVLID